jgi:4-diphosphocytidyl-2-C-methyl-D-erythritol kinase
LEIAARLGADVPSQLAPGTCVGTGAGDAVEPVAPLVPHAWVLVPQAFGLSTASVYGEADRLALPHSADALAARRGELAAALASGSELPVELMVNELAPAALSLRPEIGRVIEAVSLAGADHALVCGSGPTVAGLFWGDALARASEAAATLERAYPGACAASPVGEAFGTPAPLGRAQLAGGP